MRRLLVVVALTGMAAGLSVPVAATASGARPPGPAVTRACSNLGVIKRWTIARRADQLVVVPVDESTVTALLPDSSSGFPYGGVLLFGASAPSDLGSQIAVVRARVPLDLGLLVMTDEEGGGVQRMANLVGGLPWAASMGSHWSAHHIEAVAERVGAAMARNGVNVDLAPVLDVDGRHVYPGPTDPDGFRSFSGNPAVVARDGVAFMLGMQRGGVLAVVKHFPGLGGSSGNTDDGPATTLPWSQIQTVALPPFEAAIAAGAGAVMVSNAVVPGLTKLPASISEPATTAVLKNEMGFKGLVITDSLSAGALADIGDSVPVAAVKAIAAGADMVLFGPEDTAAQARAVAGTVSAAIVAAVAHGVIPTVRLDTSVLAVLQAKHLDLC